MSVMVVGRFSYWSVTMIVGYIREVTVTMHKETAYSNPNALKLAKNNFGVRSNDEQEIQEVGSCPREVPAILMT